jgi:hypothetical protein
MTAPAPLFAWATDQARAAYRRAWVDARRTQTWRALRRRVADQLRTEIGAAKARATNQKTKGTSK